ncbi:DivIVA domain-containing protein [Nonomuraea sp. NPDC059194]|uniref:DivIVA domain-containing protein n=1 Tax=Nonomuraea sp. NPDC059194 TaxID=3346764 RepID=UPI0036ABD8D2
MCEGHEGHDHAGGATTHLHPTLYRRGGALLTPAEVHHQVFTTVRFREGYDLAEVDAFLGQVEVTINTILRENTELSAQLAAAQAIRPGSAAVGDSAARIVAVAQEAADQALSDARGMAEQILAEARAQADTLLGEAAQMNREAAENLQRSRNRVRNILQMPVGELRGLLDEFEPDRGEAATLPRAMTARDVALVQQHARAHQPGPPQPGAHQPGADSHTGHPPFRSPRPVGEDV